MPPISWWVPLLGVAVLVAACFLAWGAGLYLLAHGADEASTFVNLEDD